MKYWVIKGNPKGSDGYDWDADLAPDYIEPWGARSIPGDFTAGDRLFLWESGGRSRVIGFGRVEKVGGARDANGRMSFDVRYLTDRPLHMPGIRDLRRIPLLRTASFLQPGPFATIYPLSSRQARALYRHVVVKNPRDHLWQDLSRAHLPKTPKPDIDIDIVAIEGNPRLVAHLRRERDPVLARLKKAQFRETHGRLSCETCGSDHAAYGELAESVFEVHHLQALGRRKKGTRTRLSDLAILCSNCHRAVHRSSPLSSLGAFRRRLKAARPKI